MISVCMLTYNGEKYLREQVISILSQLSEKDELIVSDDGSTDNTISILESFDDSRIKIFHHKSIDSPYTGALRNAHIINRNMENALIHASGDIIFMADQDDIWKANKVQRILTELANNDLVIHSYDVIDADKQYKYSVINKRKGTTLLQTLYKPSFKGCCMAFNRKIYKYALPFPNYAVEHDTWIGLCSIKHGCIKYIEDTLLQYRRHGNNVSPEFGKSKNSLYVRLKRRVLMLKAYWQQK